MIGGKINQIDNKLFIEQSHSSKRMALFVFIQLQIYFSFHIITSQKQELLSGNRLLSWLPLPKRQGSHKR